MIATTYEDTDPDLSRPPPSLDIAHAAVPVNTGPDSSPEASDTTGRVARRVLLFGWSHKVPALLGELLHHDADTEVCVVSSLAKDKRETVVQRYLGDELANQVRHVEADYTQPIEIERLQPQAYDNIVFIGSDWVRSGEASDARTIVGYLVLSRYLSTQPGRTNVLVELLDAENVALLGTRPRDVLISPVVLSHMLAQVALRPELNQVFSELFAARGAEVAFRSAARYRLTGRALTFSDLVEAAIARGETALGFATFDGEGKISVSLNPERSRRFELASSDEVVVVAR